MKFKKLAMLLIVSCQKLQFSILITAATIFNGCEKDDDDDDKIEEESGYVDIKNDDWRSRIGDTLEVTGYLKLNSNGSGVLFYDKNDIDINGLIAESRYIVLGSENIRGLDPNKHYLSQVKLKGIIRATGVEDRQIIRGIAGDISQFELKVIETPLTITPGSTPPPPIDLDIRLRRN